MNTRFAMTIVALALLTPVGCRRGEIDGPPELRVGRDQCIECGMLISEDRCSAGVLLERDGVREHALFDDVGCFVEWLADNDGGRPSVVRVYLRDYDARAWLEADSAVVLRADPDRLHTPMGSGIVAFSDRAGAERSQAASGGTITTFGELLASPPTHP